MKLGNNELINIQIGNTKVNSIKLGNTLVYNSGILNGILSPSLLTGGFAVGTSRLFGSYSGPLIRLRRGSDSVEQDAGSGVPRLTSDEVIGLVGKNLHGYSEDLASIPSVRSTVNSNTLLAPDGTLTADTLVATDTTLGAWRTVTNLPLAAGARYTFSRYYKAGTKSTVRHNVADGTDHYAVFDLAAGTASGATNIESAAVTNEGGGWFRCSITWIATTTTSTGQAHARFADSTLTTADTVHAWGAQVEAGTLTAYEARGATGASPCYVPKLYDQIGANNALQTTGSLQPQIIPRQIGEKNVMQFDGVDDYLDCGTAVGDYTTNFTIAMWVRTSSPTEVILASRRTGATVQYSLGITATGKFYVYDGTTGRNSNTSVNTGTWAHLAYVFSGGNVEQFVNGVSDGSARSISITSRPSESYIIGKIPASALGTFKGQMGHHLVLGNALTAQQILAMYNATKGEYGL